MTELTRIRNICTVAHIDHGKSTLADRMLELTGLLKAGSHAAQYLDRMDLERERGHAGQSAHGEEPSIPGGAGAITAGGSA